MKCSRLSLLGLALAAAVVAGCGKSDSKTSPTAAGDAAAQPAVQQTAASAEASPGEVIGQFLEALRTGSDEKAMALLTPLARQKAIETGRSPTPEASDTARFQVGEVKFPQEGVAHIDCQWTDLDQYGKPRTDRAIWVCRREAEGWRVGGVAAFVLKNKDPLLLNFEDPDDMERKQQWLREEVAREEKQQATKEAQADSGEAMGPAQAGKSPDSKLR